MTRNITRQASAFGSAAIVTLAMLAGTHQLATQARGDLSVVAKVTPAAVAAAQVVVVVGQRASRS